MDKKMVDILIQQISQKNDIHPTLHMTLNMEFFFSLLFNFEAYFSLHICKYVLK
jgi:hypothetical protein